MQRSKGSEQGRKNWEAIKKYIQEISPGNQPDELLAKDTKFGIMDPFFFDKMKVDKNGVASSVKLIHTSYDSMKDLIKAFQATPAIFEGKATIAYKPINDNYHFILIKKLNITKNNLEKYLVLL